MQYATADSINRIIHNFSHHPPTADQVESHEAVRTELRNVAHALDRLVPVSREKSLMFTALEEALMWANAGIARNDER